MDAGMVPHYLCKLCDYKCSENQIEEHKLSQLHSTHSTVMRDNLKKDNKLYLKYLIELNLETDIDDETPKSKKMLIEEIIDSLSNQMDESVPEILISNEPHLKLIHELTQFTHGKTEQMLNIIAERYLLNTINQEEHLIQITITNKNLLETRHWKIRTKSKMSQYENIDVVILSSHPDSEYHNIDKYINNIFTAKTKNELPNVLIACFHKTRIENILKLLDTFKGKSFMVDSAKIYFNISFDEPDANLGLCSSFLKNYKLYKNIIKNIEFITATPYDDFWKMLNDNGIVKLLNPKYQGQDGVCKVSESYEEHLENYMQIKNHNHIRCDYKTSNPLTYIRHVFENEYVDKSVPYINMEDGLRKIIFSPAHTCIDREGVGSHEEVVKFYTDKGFAVYLSNGRFKGFIEPTGEKVTLDEFNKMHQITGELRDSLRKWEEINPKDKAITGYWTIERGITFQTDGFNFTHMIISDYHKRLLNKLVQLIGRCNGNKRYIQNKCNIICPQEIIDTVNDYVTKTIELRQGNPENYNFTDFTDKNSCIPVKVTFVDEEYRLFCVQIQDKMIFHNILKEGYQTGKILLEDRNNIRVFTNDKKNKTNLFDDVHKKINGVRKYKEGDKASARRFKQFNENFNSYKPSSQKSGPGEYNIDLAIDRYEHDGFVNEVTIAWITFMY